MLNFGDHEEFRPICYIRGYPLYASGLLVLIHVAAFVATAVLLGLKENALLLALAFVPEQFFGGWIWQLFTYPFVKLRQMTDPFAGIWFLVEMGLLFTAGREIERYMGRWNLLNLYTWMVVIPVAVASLLTLFGAQTMVMGSFLVHAGLFFAFAAVYPGIQLWGGVPARYVAVGIGAVWSLIFLAQNDWVYLLGIWANAGYAWLAIGRYKEGNEVLFWPDFRQLRTKPRLRVLPDPATKPRQPPHPRASRGHPDASHKQGDPRAQLDALLDKIAEHGIASLTDRERRQLEQLRERLLEQEGAREDRS